MAKYLGFKGSARESTRLVSPELALGTEFKKHGIEHEFLHLTRNPLGVEYGTVRIPTRDLRKYDLLMAWARGKIGRSTRKNVDPLELALTRLKPFGKDGRYRFFTHVAEHDKHGWEKAVWIHFAPK